MSDLRPMTAAEFAGLTPLDCKWAADRIALALKEREQLREAVKYQTTHAWHSPTCRLQVSHPCDCGVDAWCRVATAILKGADDARNDR